MKVVLQDVLNAYELIAMASATTGEVEGYVCRKTGKIYVISTDELGLELDEPPDDLETSDHYLAVPTKRELNLGRDLAFDFVLDTLPDDHEDVRDMFRGSGAYRRFKDWLGRRGKLDEWHKFEDEATREAVRAWCVENDPEPV